MTLVGAPRTEGALEIEPAWSAPTRQIDDVAVTESMSDFDAIEAAEVGDRWWC